MKGGISCKCSKTIEERRKNWEIVNYKCNYSSFESPKNGYHPSDYSDLKCKKCSAMWRTKAKYVDKL